MIIGLVPGAMKPYHAGHHYLVEQAQKECDHVIIFTTAKDRKGISGLAMMNAWKTIIQPRLDAEVRFVVSPIRAVYEYLEKSDTGNTYRIYSGTEDLSRFSNKQLNKYCQHLNVCNVAEDNAAQFLRGVGDSPMAKGEWVRKAIEKGDFQAFQEYLPSFLKPYAEEYLSILVE